MSLPGDENPNPQWQRPEEPPRPQWSSGSPLGDQPQDQAARPGQAPPSWQPQQDPQAWQSPSQAQSPAPPEPVASSWQQPQGTAPVAGWVPPPRTPGQAIASLILGICGLVLCPIIPSVLALVFGYKAKGEIDRSAGGLGGRGVALTGIILGWVALSLWGLLLVLIAIGVAHS